METCLSDFTQVVVVSYNPDIVLLEKNLRALNSQFKNVLIVDNGSANLEDVKKISGIINNRIVVKSLGENMGIAFAQNVGSKEAKRKGLRWLLTMDQDSIIPNNLSAEYSQLLKKCPDAGIIGWAHVPLKKGKEVEENTNIISSGSLLNNLALEQVGGFDDALFIDHVDNDIQLKLKDLGFSTLMTNKVKMHHQIGSKTGKKTITGKYYNGHSPVRMYYIIRNGIVLFKRYFFRHPRWSFVFLNATTLELLYSLIYSDTKAKNLRIAARAIVDGIRGRMGKYPD